MVVGESFMHSDECIVSKHLEERNGLLVLGRQPVPKTLYCIQLSHE